MDIYPLTVAKGALDVVLDSLEGYKEFASLTECQEWVKEINENCEMLKIAYLHHCEEKTDDKDVPIVKSDMIDYTRKMLKLRSNINICSGIFKQKELEPIVIDDDDENGNHNGTMGNIIMKESPSTLRSSQLNTIIIDEDSDNKSSKRQRYIQVTLATQRKKAIANKHNDNFAELATEVITIDDNVEDSSERASIDDKNSEDTLLRKDRNNQQISNFETSLKENHQINDICSSSDDDDVKVLENVYSGNLRCRRDSTASLEEIMHIDDIVEQSINDQHNTKYQAKKTKSYPLSDEPKLTGKSSGPKDEVVLHRRSRSLNQKFKQILRRKQYQVDAYIDLEVNQNYSQCKLMEMLPRHQNQLKGKFFLILYRNGKQKLRYSVRKMKLLRLLKRKNIKTGIN